MSIQVIIIAESATEMAHKLTDLALGFKILNIRAGGPDVTLSAADTPPPAPTAPVDAAAAPAAVEKRGPGRPRGSRKRPSAATPALSETTEATLTTAPAPPPPTDTPPAPYPAPPASAPAAGNALDALDAAMAATAPAAASATSNGHDTTNSVSSRDAAVDLAMGLDLLRAVYERPGAQAVVANLLTKYAVAKFSEITPDRGFELLTDAQRLDEETKPI